MSAIQIKDSFKRINLFLKEGCTIFDNDDYDNKIVISYKDYLISIDNKEKSILLMLRTIYLLKQFLISVGKNFESFNK